jgi:Rrf2 family protein
MKLITRDTDYAVRALSCIAGSGDKVFTVDDLSEKLSMPRPYLRKILQILNRKGILKSFKGRGGGFSLVVDPRKISIFDLMEIFQGSFQLSEHLFKGEKCPMIRACKLKKKLDLVERVIIKELKFFTIESMLKKK